MECCKVTTKIAGSEQPVIFRELMSEIPSTTYATFGLYKYPAKFIPQVIAYALTAYGRPGMSVIDPFAGYGTVGTVARLCGNNYELWDLNPLLKYLHSIAIMQPIEVDSAMLVRDLTAHTKPFAPDWQNITYWYPEQFLPMLSRVWGFYHSLEDKDLKQILLIPLLKTTRYFSYNDEKRQKLSRSPLAKRRTDKLEADDWQNTFAKMVRRGIDQVLDRLREYQELEPKRVEYDIFAGVDALTHDIGREQDILITSPPYLQAQEYIRATKMDLFWLGYSEDYIRELGKKEFPYQDVPEIPIYSDTYAQCLESIKEPHMAQLFQRYFYGVIGTLTRLQKCISDKLLLFVGPATIRTVPIPIDHIFVEHFRALGWKHEITLIDTIVARAMFFYRLNPATGVKDSRMSTEHLVVLSRE
jgi:DNA modification methylase